MGDEWTIEGAGGKHYVITPAKPFGFTGHSFFANARASDLDCDCDDGTRRRLVSRDPAPFWPLSRIAHRYVWQRVGGDT